MNAATENNYPKIVENAHIWFLVSGFLLLLSILAIGASFYKYKAPVLLGLDFVGGTKIEYKFKEKNATLTSQNVADKALIKIGKEFASSSIAQISEQQILILRAKELNDEQRALLDGALKENFGEFEVSSVDTVSPTIGPELLWSGLLSLGITLGAICLYVSYRFRQDFAICTILALIHDVIIVVGLFAILGLLKNIEVNSLFLTACLTVLGFSVHDTIVVFDRVRENMKFLSKKNNLTNIINMSIGQVWFRSFSTSLTVLMSIGALFVFGGETTSIFSGAMFVGMFCGTYSSIFVAASILGRYDQAKNKAVK